jgi:undecaprenyl pyrophosphate phosphatase UppP
LTGAAVALVSGIAAIWFCVRLLRSGSLHRFANYAWPVGLARLAWLRAHGGS